MSFEHFKPEDLESLWKANADREASFDKTPLSPEEVIRYSGFTKAEIRLIRSSNFRNRLKEEKENTVADKTPAEAFNDSLNDVLPLHDETGRSKINTPVDTEADPLTDALKTLTLFEAVEEQIPKHKWFEGYRVHIVGGAFYPDTVRLFAQFGWKRADLIANADLVVFIGGEDVSPYLYGQRELRTTYANSERDRRERAVFEAARTFNVPMFGICRGLQFLHVMNQGELWQDVDSHAGKPHLIRDHVTNENLLVTSLHHQMIMPGLNEDEMKVIATVPVALSHHFSSDDFVLSYNKDSTFKRIKTLNGKAEITDVPAEEAEPEIEAAYYPKTMSLGVQGHPEIGAPQYQSWSMMKIADMFEDLGIEAPKGAY